MSSYEEYKEIVKQTSKNVRLLREYQNMLFKKDGLTNDDINKLYEILKKKIIKNTSKEQKKYLIEKIKKDIEENFG